MKMSWNLLRPVVVVSVVFAESIDDGVELLQTKIMVRSLDGDVLQASQNEFPTDANLASMDTYLSSLESVRDPETGSWGEAEKTALEALKTSLTQQFTKFLEGEHEDDKNDYTAKKDVHNLCITHASTGFAPGGDVTGFSDAVTSTKNKHKACRASEKSWAEYVAVAASVTSCPLASGPPTMHELYDQHNTLFAAMVLATSQAEAYADLEEIGLKRACNMDQLDYEDKWCEWRDARGWACSGLEGCIAQVGLASLKSSLEVRSSNRQKLWHTITKLLCRIDHLLTTIAVDDKSDFSTDDTCDATELDTTKFALSLEIPPYTPCSDDGMATEPGGPTCNAWLAQEFGWSALSHVVPTECQTQCPAVTFTTSAPHAPIANCENQDMALCQIYDIHHDACGKYPEDDAETKCCACGGGNSLHTVNAVDGCSMNAGCEFTNDDAELDPATGLASVRCCSMDGQSCYSHCPADTKMFTLDAAKTACADKNMRLCTILEAKTGTCCGSGCGYDCQLIWISP